MSCKATLSTCSPALLNDNGFHPKLFLSATGDIPLHLAATQHLWWTLARQDRDSLTTHGSMYPVYLTRLVAHLGVLPPPHPLTTAFTLLDCPRHDAPEIPGVYQVKKYKSVRQRHLQPTWPFVRVLSQLTCTPDTPGCWSRYNLTTRCYRCLSPASPTPLPPFLPLLRLPYCRWRCVL